MSNELVHSRLRLQFARMERAIAYIGFGEAAAAFAGACEHNNRASGFDLKTTILSRRAAKFRDFDVAGVTACQNAAAALLGAKAVLSLVTADQALAAAKQYAQYLEPGTLWLDMNSVAPETKRAAANAVDAAGGRYVDVAVMAPVYPKRLSVPLLVSGPHAKAAAEELGKIGFNHVQVQPGDIGAASAVKMIRSVLVKGIEALTAECMLAAEAAGLRDAVLASLDNDLTPSDWSTRVDYNLDRMIVHGTRRAAEMVEVVKTLAEFGTGSGMSEATVLRQQQIGRSDIMPNASLGLKLASLLQQLRKEGAT